MISWIQDNWGYIAGFLIGILIVVGFLGMMLFVKDMVEKKCGDYTSYDYQKGYVPVKCEQGYNR